MIKIQAFGFMAVVRQDFLASAARKIRSVLAPAGLAGLLSEDFEYKWRFLTECMPELYRRHADENRANCVFCANLARCGRHRHCFSCRVDVRMKCGPLLPGVIYKMPSYGDDAAETVVPWYCRNPCGDFERLPSRLYSRNLYPLFSPVGIHNMEILEGLETGLSCGMRPCHACASVDYGIYKKCASRADFDAGAPCRSILSELVATYKKRAPDGRPC